MIYRFDDFRLDTGARQLLRGDEPVEVPRRVFDCLCCLLAGHARALARDELIRCVWGRSNVSDNQLAQTILRARRLLSDDGDSQRYIRTVPGFGYHWTAPLQVEADTEGLPAAPLEPSNAAATPQATLHTPGRTPRPRSRQVLIGGLALLALLLALLFWRGPGAPAALDARPLAVQVAQVTDPQRARWARHGLSALVGSHLQRAGLEVLPWESLLPAADGSEQSPPAPSPSLNRLDIRASHDADSPTWQVSLRLQRVDSAVLEASAEHVDLIEAAEAAVAALLAAERGSPAPAASGSSPLVQAERALRSSDFEGARAALARIEISAGSPPEAALLAIEVDLASGQLQRAGERIEALQTHFNRLTSPALRARLQLAHSQWGRRMGRPETQAALDPLIAELETLTEPLLLGRALQARGTREVGAGRIENATADFARAHGVFRAAGEHSHAASASGNLALLLMLRGDNSEALMRLAEAADVYRESGDIGRLFAAYSSMASIEVGRLRWQEALLRSDQAQALLPLVEDAAARQRHLRPRALVMLGLGRLSQAEALLAQSAAEAEDGESSPDTQARQGIYEAQIALARLQAGRAERAALEVFEPLYERYGVAMQPQVRTDARDLALLLLVQARLLGTAAGQPPTALPAQAEHLLSQAESVLALIAQGRWLQANGDPQRAEQVLRRALEQAERFNRLSRVLSATEALVELLLQQGRHEDAQALLLVLKARDPDLIERDFEVAVLAAKVALSGSDRRAATQAVQRARALAGERPLPAPLDRAVPGSGRANKL